MILNEWNDMQTRYPLNTVANDYTRSDVIVYKRFIERIRPEWLDLESIAAHQQDILNVWLGVCDVQNEVDRGCFELCVREWLGIPEVPARYITFNIRFVHPTTGWIHNSCQIQVIDLEFAEKHKGDDPKDYYTNYIQKWSGSHGYTTSKHIGVSHPA